MFFLCLISWFFCGVFGLWLSEKLDSYYVVTVRDMICWAPFGPIVILTAILFGDWGDIPVFQKKSRR
jgi:hypothetical protein